MAVTQNSYVGDGSTTTYSFTFPYIKKSEIKASLDATDTTAFITPTATTVQFNTAPASGVKIKIFRETDSDSLAATFYAGSAIKSEDLNDNFTQNIYATQEINARYLSNLGGIMVGDLQLGEDVVIKFEGATDNDYETTLTVTDPTADRTITLPNETGTVITTVSTNVIDSDHYVDGSIDNEHLAANSVDSDQYVDGSIDQIHMSANSVDSDQYVDGSIDHIHLSNDCIDGDNIQNDAINSEHYAAGSIDNEHLAANSVDSDQYVDGSIDGVHIGNDQIDSQHYVAGSIDNEHLAANSVDSDQYVDGSIDQIHMSANSVDSDQYVDGSIDHVHLANDCIDGDNIQNDAINSEHIAAGAVDNEHMAANSVDSDQYVDGSIDRVHLAADIIDASKIEDDAVTTDHIQDAELVTLAGMPSATASILADTTALTSTTAELNILDNKSFRASGDGALTTTSDTEIPSSKVIANHVAAQLGTVGGFTTIATEVAFPATASQPASGVIVSISDAAGIVVNGSGVSTTGRTTDGTPATVTINSFPSSLNGETLASGVGLLVTSTGSGNTYTYHKLLAAESDVKQLSDDINDFNARYRVAGSAPGSNNDAGDMYFDTTANKMKVYNGTTSTWDDVASVGNFYINTISSSSGTGGGSASFNNNAYRFTLSNPPTMAQQLIVSVNGVIQKPNSGSSQPSEGFAISGNDIIFAAAPAANSDYFIVTQGSSVSIGTPSDNTVSTAKIQNLGVTTAKLAAGAVTNAKITDDTIAEVKLDIHNTPASGKYLKYTSNGMEWADGASEGTDVKSTGESGTAKFLRVDGDGTCSWQVPPDTNTQLTLKDEDDFASNSDTAAASQQSIKAYVDTQVGSISSAPEITGTASGTITADKPCIIKSDGTIDQVEATVTEQTPAGVVNVPGNSAQDGDAMHSGTAQTGQAIAYDEVNNTFLMGSRISNYIYVKLGYYADASSTDISWGTLLSAGGGYSPGICFDSSKECYVVFRNQESTTEVKLYKYNSAKTDVTNSASASLPSGYAGEYPSIMYHTGIQKPVITFVESAKVYVAILHINSDATSVTVGTPFRVVSSSTASQYQPQIFEDTTRSGRIYVGARYDHDDHYYIHNLTIPSSGDSFTRNGFGQKAVDGASSNDRITNFVAITYDPEAGKALLVYREGSNATKGIVLTPSDSSCSIGSKVGLMSSSDTDRAHYMALVYDKGLKKLVLVWQKLVDDEKVKAAVMTISGTSVSMGTKSSVLTNGSTTVGQTHGASHHSGAYNTKLGQILWVGKDSGNNTWARVWNLQCHTSVTNLTTENFVGFPKATYTNGQTATIKVVGNTSTQSSLTPGQKYYVQKDGTVKSSADTINVEAGLAISSTKLLIR